MKICLIYNGIGIAGFNANRPIGDREGSWIGHGIASIGACVKEAGHKVSLIDMRQLSGYMEFEKIIKENPSEVYGISISAVDHWHSLKTILVLKKNLPDCKIIIGGIHPTIFPEKYDYEAIDTIVQGEGEVTFIKLLNQIEQNETLPKIIRGEKPVLDELPFVARDLFNYKRELGCNFTPSQAIPAITMLAGRGCPYRCSYCQPAENSVFGHPCRMRSPENVIQELKELKNKYYFKSITFWDDTFTFNPKWIERFCELYSEIKIPFVACSRADIICKNEDMVKSLSKVGCEWFVIGLESGSQRLLDFIKKGTTVEQNIKAGEICRKYGIKVFGTYMYGLPTELPEDSNATTKMIKKIKPDFASPFWFLPIEGTDIYKYCEENNLILPEVKDRTIARTGMFNPTLKNINYEYIKSIMV